MIRIRAILGARSVVLIVFLMTVSAMLWRALSTSGEIETDLEKRPQRLITYVVTPTQGPSFPMSSITGRLRVMTFLHLNTKLVRSEYTPQTTFDYGLEVSVLEAGRAVFRHKVWYTTRKSKIGGKGERWEQESAYYPVGDEEGEPCDPRMTEIDLSPWFAPNRTVELRSIAPVGGTPPELNAIAFARFERDSERVDWALDTTGPERLRHASADLGLELWSVPLPQELRRMYNHGWRRQSTAGAAVVRSLFTTGYRAVEYNPATEGVTISKSQAVAFNLEGPAKVRFAAIAAGGGGRHAIVRELGHDAAADRLTWSERTLQMRAFRDVSELAAAGEDDPRFVVYQVDALKVASLQVIGVDDAAFRLVMMVDRHDAVRGEPRMHRASAGGFLVRPDVKSFTGWLVDESRGTQYLLGDGNEGAPDVILLTTRVPSTQVGSVLRYEFEGTDIKGELVPVGNSSPFEVASNAALTLDPIPLTEPTSLRLIVPKSATHLKLSATGQHFVSVSVLTLGDDDAMIRKLRAPYDQAPGGLKWRYAPSEMSPWFGVNPDDALSLEAMMRRWRIESQVRLEPDFDSAIALRSARNLADTTFPSFYAPPEHRERRGVARTVAPSSRAQTQVLQELASRQPQTQNDVEKLAQAWDPTYASVFNQNTEWACRVPDGKPLRIAVAASRGGVGAGYEVFWNGEPLRRRLMRSSRDTMVVSVPSARGRLRFAWQSEAAVRLTSNCRPVAPSHDVKVVRLRRVYALRAKRPITLRLTSAEVTWLLNSVSYSATGARVQVTVDDGVPRRREGQVSQITAATRILEWPPPSLPAWLEGDVSSSLRGAVSHAIPIGADWVPGSHRVRLELIGGAQVVWMRFFRMD